MAKGTVQSKEAETPPKKGTAKGPKAYSDGHPLDQVHYREYKIILRPERFTKPTGFHDFAKLVHHGTAELDLAYFADHTNAEHQIRTVVFFDTPKFDLYNNSFILRRRTVYRDGFPAGDSEIVMKFRNADMDLAAGIDVRPAGTDKYRIKFKEELLPLHNEVGGMRSLFSHNCVLAVDAAATEEEPIKNAAAIFPALRRVGISAKRDIDLVNHVAVEEVLADLGEVNFGHGLHAKANVAVWRNRGTLQPLVGEFAYQCKFDRFDELHKKARKRADEFFHMMQTVAADWVQVGATKTRIVYGMSGHGITNRE
jgi:hypothetical protein